MEAEVGRILDLLLRLSRSDGEPKIKSGWIPIDVGPGTGDKCSSVVQTILGEGKIPEPSGVVLVDASPEMLSAAAGRLTNTAFSLPVTKINSDVRYGPLAPSDENEAGRPQRVFMFLGATLGNFRPSDQLLILLNFQRHMKPGDLLVLGVFYSHGETLPDSVPASYATPAHDTFCRRWLTLNVHRIGADSEASGPVTAALLGATAGGRRTVVIQGSYRGHQVELHRSHRYSDPELAALFAVSGLVPVCEAESEQPGRGRHGMKTIVLTVDGHGEA